MSAWLPSQQYGSIVVLRPRCRQRHWCPDSEVRKHAAAHILMRTSESKGHQQLYDSSAPFEPEVRNRVRGTSGSHSQAGLREQCLVVAAADVVDARINGAGAHDFDPHRGVELDAIE